MGKLERAVFLHSQKVVQEPEKTMLVSITLCGFCKSCFSRWAEYKVTQIIRFSSLMADRSFSWVFVSKDALITVNLINLNYHSFVLRIFLYIQKKKKNLKPQRVKG